MLEWILSSTVLAAVIIAVRWLFRDRLKMTVRYALWGLVLVRLLLPFSIGKAVISVGNWVDTLTAQPVVLEIMETPIPVQSQESAYREALEDYRQQGVHVEQLDENTLNYIRQEAKTQAEKRPLGDILAQCAKVLWIAGAALVAGFFLFSNGRFGKDLWQHRRYTGLRKGKLPVFSAETLDSPCLFGIVKPAIFVTEEVLRDPTLLRHTLEHEATHHRHGDHIWAVLRGLCLALHWYNPLVWIAAVLSQRDGEMACDEATVARLGEGERAEYGRTLIGMTCGKKTDVLLTATRMTNGSLRQRILMIAKKPKMAGYILAAVALIAAVAVGCTFAGSMPEETPSEDPGEEIWDTKPHITYEGVEFYVEEWAVTTLPEGYEYIGDLPQEAAGYTGHGGYRMFALKDREKLDHFYLYGETGTKIGNIYYQSKKQMAYILYGSARYIPLDEKEAAKVETYFRNYDPNGTFLGIAENYAVIYRREDTPKLQILKFMGTDGIVTIMDQRTGAVKRNKGISINHLELQQGHLYFGTLADQRGIWETIKIFCEDGNEKILPILGRDTWFVQVSSPLESFQILTASGTVALDMKEFTKRNRIEEISFYPADDTPVAVPEDQPPKVTEPQPTEPQETQPRPTTPPQAFVPDLPSLKQRDPVRAEIENANIGPLYSQTDPTLISIMVQPTGITRSGDHLSYVIPENQDAFMAAFQNSLKHYEKGEYVEKGPTAGFYICYQGEKWRMMTNGTMIWFYGEGGTIEAAELYGLCVEELEKTGLEGTVRPEELVGIQSATLEWNGTHTVTDKNALAYLERLFANSRELYSGAACPFYGMLTLKLENGAEKVIAIAVDDCCAWMSNGVYYQYTDGDLEEELANSVFYSLFYPDIIHGALEEGKDPLEWIHYMHWSLYDSLYGKQETLKLMEALGEYSRSSGHYSATFYCLNGLDEKYRPIYAEFLAKLAEGDKGAFAYDYFDTYSELRERITALLAEHWNLTPEETDARLREYRNAQ